MDLTILPHQRCAPHRIFEFSSCVVVIREFKCQSKIEQITMINRRKFNRRPPCPSIWEEGLWQPSGYWWSI